MTPSTTADHDWVSAAPFRAHLVHLLGASGLSCPVVATAAGVPQRTLERLIASSPHRARRLRRQDAERLLALTPGWLSAVPRRLVSAQRARACLRRLAELGWDDDRIARHTQLSRAEVRQVADPGRGQCPQLTELLLRALLIEALEAGDTTPASLGHMSQRRDPLRPAA